jgi:hypothetical protein
MAAAHAEDDADVNVAAQTPPIHVEQQAVLLRDGKPVEETNYRELLADCRKGPFPVKALDEETASKLGRTFYSLSFEGTRMAVHSVSWALKAPDPAAPPCQFAAEKAEHLTVVAPGRLTVVDLVSREARSEPSEGVMRYAVTPPSPAEDDLEAAVRRQLQAAGHGNVMPEKLSDATVAGQPCRRTHTDVFGDVCIWSGGEPWGFTADTTDTSNGPDRPVDNILLSADPTDGTGIAWMTQSMTIGTPVNPSDFAIPSGISETQ